MSLTDDEHALLDALSDVARQFRTMLRPGDSATNAADWAEVASRLHDLQARVLAKSAQREYDRYRLPGSSSR